MRTHLAFAAAFLAASASWALAEEVSVEMHKITAEGVGDKVGTVTHSDGEGGLTLKVAVTGVPAGEHGFHVHQKADCGPGEKDGKMAAGIAAGGHFDPQDTKSHKGPEGDGHEGDLPKLQSTAHGIDTTVTAPRLKLADVLGHSLMIHEGGDTYSDKPEMGGGKGRIVCGVIPKS
jgi:Cu-Zn family superoxide dismutase